MKTERLVDMAMVASVLFLVLVVISGCSAAHASRSCLSRNEAARTWPSKELVRDGDGCWTYSRVKRVPVENSGTLMVTAPEELLSWLDTTAALRKIEPVLPASIWLDRWPEVVVIPAASPPIFEPRGTMQPRHVVMVILAVAMTVTLIEVMFGGMVNRKDIVG